MEACTACARIVRAPLAGADHRVFVAVEDLAAVLFAHVIRRVSFARLPLHLLPAQRLLVAALRAWDVEVPLVRLLEGLGDAAGLPECRARDARVLAPAFVRGEALLRLVDGVAFSVRFVPAFLVGDQHANRPRRELRWRSRPGQREMATREALVQRILGRGHRLDFEDVAQPRCVSDHWPDAIVADRLR